ncbi:MAG: amino acid-binding protein, partial [Syntrophobacterales bacterium]
MRRTKMKNYLYKTFVTVVSLALALFFVSGASAQDAIKIGAMYPLSGPMALLGNHGMNGVELATEIFNERGGVGGKKIELVKADAPTAEAAGSGAERLINVEKLNVIFGTYSSSLSYVASSVAEKYKKIYWETGAIADTITQRGFKYVFRNCTQASNFGEAAADFSVEKVAKELGIPLKDFRVCIMYEDSLYG